MQYIIIKYIHLECGPKKKKKKASKSSWGTRQIIRFPNVLLVLVLIIKINVQIKCCTREKLIENTLKHK